ARYINVGRGQLVDEVELYVELLKLWFAGAAIYDFNEEALLADGEGVSTVGEWRCVFVLYPAVHGGDAHRSGRGRRVGSILGVRLL
ncbi:hypothetical protein PUR28_00005, partial [Streptomyces sp. BE308]|nr:hypothetical protein [Streptomyces sp. BE308]